MSTPELEKVADAVSEAMGWSRSPGENEMAVHVARAALLSIREPSQRMQEAMRQTDWSNDPQASFTAAIDAALGEDKP